jgi:HSP20 family protein
MFDTQNTFDKLFDDTLMNMLSNFKIKTESMKIDNDALRVEFNVPGLSKDDFKIMVEDTILVIDGKSQSRRFFKKYNVSDDWDVTKTSANVENGILTITIPKKEIQKSKSINIPVN